MNNSKTRKLLIALVTIVMLAALGLTVMPVMADDDGGTTATATPTPINPFLTKVAGHLNVSVDQMKSAFEAAQIDLLNEAVQDGRLTQAQADKIKERIEQNGSWGPGMRGYGRPGFGPGGRFQNGWGPGILNILDKAVEEGIISQEQSDQIKDLAKEKVNILDEAVTNGIISQEQADQITQFCKDNGCPNGCPNGIGKKGPCGRGFRGGGMGRGFRGGW
ncbi:MAG: hypothetical protein WC749_04800 [Dehalococcoidia bacterium]